MKTYMKIYIGIISMLLIIFILELFGLGMTKFFSPKYENVRREVWENTKSRVHGTISDIANYYEQYNKGNKEVIAEVVKQRFPEFDANLIKSKKIRDWFVEVRGY